MTLDHSSVRTRLAPRRIVGFVSAARAAALTIEFFGRLEAAHAGASSGSGHRRVSAAQPPALDERPSAVDAAATLMVSCDGCMTCRMPGGWFGDRFPQRRHEVVPIRPLSAPVAGPESWACFTRNERGNSGTDGERFCRCGAHRLCEARQAATRAATQLRSRRPPFSEGRRTDRPADCSKTLLEIGGRRKIPQADAIGQIACSRKHACSRHGSFPKP